MKIIIVGAGIMGRCLAYFAVRTGWQVTLVDAGPRSAQHSCSYAAAGLLTPYAELEHANPCILPLALASLALWPTIIESLPSPVTFALTGSIWLAHRQDQRELQRLYGILTAKAQSASGNQPLQPLNDVGLQQLEPDLGDRFSSGLYLPEEGSVDVPQLLIALEQDLLAHHVTWLENTTATSVQPHTVTLAEQTLQADWVFDCRGLGARVDWPALRGVRGELIWLHAPEVNLTRPVRLLHPRYAVYVVPRAGHHYVIGASSIESEDDSPISVQSTMELLSAAYSVHSGFAEARMVKTIAHCRPTLPSHLPAMITQPGLIRINGLYRHGYLLAPQMATLAMRAVQQEVIENQDAFDYFML
jgi:glycine oxidase